MSFKESDMYPAVRTALRTRYPASEGWEIEPQAHRGSYIPDFIIEKKSKIYTYRILVEVKATCKATLKDVSQLNRYVSNQAGQNIRILEKILVYPSGADISIVPNTIKVIRLTRFKCVLK